MKVHDGAGTKDTWVHHIIEQHIRQQKARPNPPQRGRCKMACDACRHLLATYRQQRLASFAEQSSVPRSAEPLELLVYRGKSGCWRALRRKLRSPSCTTAALCVPSICV